MGISKTSVAVAFFLPGRAKDLSAPLDKAILTLLTAVAPSGDKTSKHKALNMLVCISLNNPQINQQDITTLYLFSYQLPILLATSCVTCNSAASGSRECGSEYCWGHRMLFA